MAEEIENEENELEETSNEGAEFSEDLFDSMLNGSFEEEEIEEEAEDVEEEDDVEDEEVEDAEDDLEDEDEDSEDQEDTDLEEDEEDEDEPDDLDDGEDDEESESDEDDEEEDALVEDYDSDDEDDDTDEEDEEDDESLEDDEDDIDEESEDDAETDEASDGEPLETDGIDYKAFYDAVVNTEFTVNGKKSKGFADPKKVIQSMQMAGGFSEKMAGFKKYRPFMAPLQERGMLEDQTKFDLAMNIIDGDKEAIKKHLESLSIDPLDLDMESIQYEGKATTASTASLVVDDAVERAKSGGYEDQFRQVIGKDWDSESFNEFIENPKVRADLLDHMESGAYDKVTDKMSEMSRLDHNGAFGNMSTIAKYRAAVSQLQAEAPEVREDAPEPVPVTVPKTAKPKVKKKKTPTVSEEKAKIKQARKEAAYKKELEAKDAKRAKQRKRATSMSKKKPKSKPAAKFDPLKVEGEDLSNLMDQLINGGR